MITASERIARVAEYEDAGPWSASDDPEQIMADIQAAHPDAKLSYVDIELYHAQLPGFYTPDVPSGNDEVDEDYRLSAWDD